MSPRLLNVIPELHVQSQSVSEDRLGVLERWRWLLPVWRSVDRVLMVAVLCHGLKCCKVNLCHRV